MPSSLSERDALAHLIFSDGMAREHFYRPKEFGFEREIQKRLEYWAKLRAQKTSGKAPS